MKSRFSAKNNSSNQGKENSNSAPKVAVLLTNLGSPAAPNTAAVRNYLREFLSDPRVVEIPRVIWMLILHGFILRLRPKKSAKLYQSIWTDQGAPLVVISQAQRKKVATQIKQQCGEDIIVDIAMRYGEPSISSVLEKFQICNQHTGKRM